VFSPAILMLYLFFYFFLAILTYGVKVPSGLFVPGIICGSTFGRIVGEIAKSSVYDSQHGDVCLGDTKEQWPSDGGELFTSCTQIFQLRTSHEGAGAASSWCQASSDCQFDSSICVDSTGAPSGHCVFPGTYALIGAASMLGGVTRMTVSLTVILLETTQDIQYLLPIMTVLIVSKWVGDFFNISLYDMHVEFKCIPFVEDLPPTGMEHLVAADVMSTNLVTFAEIEPAREVYARLSSCRHNGFPVVTKEDKISGTILRSHLVKALKMGAFCSAEGSPIEGAQHLAHDDLAVTLESDIEDVNQLSDEGFDGGKRPHCTHYFALLRSFLGFGGGSVSHLAWPSA
jgi:CBS domain-containing protein